MINVYGYTKCSTVKKALKFLDERDVKYTHIDNVVNKLTDSELMQIHEDSNQPIKKMFNTSGMKYRELGLKDILPTASLEEAIALLASDGMLVKRPLLVAGNKVVIGFKEDKWDEVL